MARRKDVAWVLGEGSLPTEHCQLAVLMDIRDELKQLNRTFGCWRFQRLPKVLDRIDKRLSKRIKLR